MTIPEKLKYLRNKTGHGQTQVAELIGITPQYYYQLESGKRVLGESAIKRISDYYGISPDFLANTAATEADLQPPNKKPVASEQKLTIPTAGKSYLFRMSDGNLCTAPVCEWRQQVDENTYYCPAGCMKERSGRIAKQTRPET